MLCHILDVESAVSYIDFNTIGVLIGMMLFVSVIKCSGLFEYISIKTAKIANGDPWRIMMMFIIVTAVLSAFLDNVTTVLLIGPMTISIAGILNLNPVPFLLSQILASNIGGTATLIGDPPNIMIGSAAGLSFVDFILNDAPIVVIILVVFVFIMKHLYGTKLEVSQEDINKVMLLDENLAIENMALLKKSVFMIFAVIAAFMLHSIIHIESCVVALTAGAIMLVIGKQDVEEIIQEVEWTTIVFFTALFVVVGGLVETGVINTLANVIINLTADKPIMTMLVLLWASALLSAILDNIPFVATLIPLIQVMGQNGIDVVPLWWAISLGACLGGNGSLIGASANVVLAGISSKHGYPITFKAFLKVGFPIMIVSVVISTIYLVLRFGL
jgi:Na+/H+ antiporter NhaD/arsenite permease-like protein